MMLRCPLCGSREVYYDPEVDEYYCGVCGYVFPRGEIDDGVVVSISQVPPGSTFKGGGRYRKLRRINNKNDLNTYRILQLQKIKEFVSSHGLPIIIYDWVIHVMKNKYGNRRWKFSYIVAVLYLGIIKFGFYRDIDEFEKYFGISKRVLWKEIYIASKDLNIDYVLNSGMIARMYAKNMGMCVNRCIDYILENIDGDLALQYGSSPRIVALTYIFLCKLYCDGDVVVSKFMKEYKIPRNSLNQNIVRIAGKFGIKIDKVNLKKDDIKKLAEVIFDGKDFKSG